MGRRSKQQAPEALRRELLDLLTDFQNKLDNSSLREQVISLIPAHRLLRDLGSSLIPEDISAARDRIIYYLKKYPLTVIQGDELMVVAGIGEWARRLRELRVQFGWAIASGYSAGEMTAEGDLEIDIPAMRPDEYILLSTEQDKEAAYRWNIANDIRKEKNLNVHNKLLKFLKANLGTPVTGEELRYVANDKTEWARRVRELRTEQGWSIVTRQTGMPDLPIGTYLLESDRQAPVHDRSIPDAVRRAVLRRDDYRCTKCGWHIEEYNRADARILELHHIEHHARGGANTEENLATLCSVCHDRLHADDWRQ